jgi:hypothetical protein
MFADGSSWNTSDLALYHILLRTMHFVLPLVLP